MSMTRKGGTSPGEILFIKVYCFELYIMEANTNKTYKTVGSSDVLTLLDSSTRQVRIFCFVT